MKNSTYKKQKYNSRTRSKYEDIQVKDSVKPDSEDGDINTLLSTKAAKGLVKSGSSITVKVDPYTSVLPESDPYALLNKLNRMTGGSYGGDDNLDGGNTRQFMTSESSAFLHNFDSIATKAKLNYRYLPIITAESRGKQFTNEMIKAISEVISTANATTFTSLISNDYHVNSNLPTGTYERTADLEYFLGGDAPGLYQWMIYYQIILQCIAGAITTFNKSRGYMGEMMRMSWNRQTPKLNSYFGLLKKKSFLAILDSLCYTIEGEYFDLDWLNQANMLSVLCSRRAEASTEPLLELSITHNVPESFSLDLADTNIYSHSYLNSLASSLQLNLGDDYPTATFTDVLETWSKLLSVNDTLSWVRSNSSITDLDRFDALIDIANYFVAVMNYFKPAMSDLRTTLDVLSRVKVNQWSKTVRMRIIDDTNAPVYRNLVLESLFKMLGGGSANMTFNDVTYRWSGHSLWNIYTGVPEYDAKSGGAFLSFSTKSLPNNIATTDPDAIAYLPIAINQVESITAVNRLGVRTNLGISTFNPSINISTARLVPIPTMNVEMRVVSPQSELGTMDLSMLQQACLKVFGGFSKQSSISGNSDLAIEPDSLCFITYEIEDLSNEMITYARTKGPFVVNVTDKTNLGFLGITTGSKAK